MITRIGHALVTSTALAMLMTGCQGKTGDAAANKPLPPEEAANYRQVVVNVTGMT